MPRDRVDLSRTHSLPTVGPRRLHEIRLAVTCGLSLECSARRHTTRELCTGGRFLGKRSVAPPPPPPTSCSTSLRHGTPDRASPRAGVCEMLATHTPFHLIALAVRSTRIDPPRRLVFLVTTRRGTRPGPAAEPIRPATALSSLPLLGGPGLSRPVIANRPVRGRRAFATAASVAGSRISADGRGTWRRLSSAGADRECIAGRVTVASWQRPTAAARAFMRVLPKRRRAFVYRFWKLERTEAMRLVRSAATSPRVTKHRSGRPPPELAVSRALVAATWREPISASARRRVLLAITRCRP